MSGRHTTLMLIVLLMRGARCEQEIKDALSPAVFSHLAQLEVRQGKQWTGLSILGIENEGKYIQ